MLWFACDFPLVFSLTLLTSSGVFLYYYFFPQVVFFKCLPHPLRGGHDRLFLLILFLFLFIFRFAFFVCVCVFFLSFLYFIECVCRACRIQHDDMALHCPLLYLLHTNLWPMQDNSPTISPAPRHSFLGVEVDVPKSKDTDKALSLGAGLRGVFFFFFCSLGAFVSYINRNHFNRFLEPGNFHVLQYLNGFGQLFLTLPRDASFLFFEKVKFDRKKRWGPLDKAV